MMERFLDCLKSLMVVMRQETECLLNPSRSNELQELVAAKQRLAGQLAEEAARLAREGAMQVETEGEDSADSLPALIASLEEVSKENMEALQRQIDLSDDMMRAVIHQVQRSCGSGRATYGATGSIGGNRPPGPVSINATL